MIQGGNATLYVSDMDRAVAFYTKTLGLKLKQRHGNHYAEVEAGPGLTIGIHPFNERAERSGFQPGRKGSVQLGFLVSRPLGEVVKTLKGRGVKFDGPIVDGGDAGRFAMLADFDGNEMYLWELASVKA